MAVKICPACGEGNKETAHICVICGSSLREVEAQGTLNSEKLYNDKRKRSSVCSYCHEPLEDGALKCKYCGTPVTRSPFSQASSYNEDLIGPIPDNTAMTLLVISTIIIPIVGLIVGGVASFSDVQDKQETGKMLIVLGFAMIVIQLIIYFWIIN